MNPKDVLLIQNTRYEDLEGKKESSNDEELGAYWASRGDVFINDAFGTVHRAHASNVGIASHKEGNSAVGFLVEKELKALSELDNPERPFMAILGGKKVSDKIGVIEALIEKVDVKGISHITGGGFYENIPRSIPDGLCAKIDREAIKVLPIFDLIMKWGNVPERDMFNTYNMGVGMTVVVPAAEVETSMELLKGNGIDAYVIGEIVEGEEKVTL